MATWDRWTQHWGLYGLLCHAQEVWSSHFDLSLEGYNPPVVFSRDQNDQPKPNCGGGVCIYVRNDIQYQNIELEHSTVKGIIESVWLKITFGNKISRIIGCIYRPNTAPLACPVKAVNAIQKQITIIKEKYKNIKIFMAGDFNLDLLNFQSHIPTNDFFNL